jgi:hypothetical protein
MTELTYKTIAEARRKEGKRAPKFKIDFFSRKEVEDALKGNKFFSHACIELGLINRNSKSQFNGLRNMHTLISHYGLSTNMLGANLKEVAMMKCPYCGKKFKKNLEV